MRKPALLRLSFLLFLTSAGPVSMPAAGHTARPSPSADAKCAEQVVHALCGKQVALLGESREHAFGRTLEFKAELVRRLVDTCHYNALFIESGTYDFLQIEKTLESGHHVTDAMIAAAIGGLWSNKEVQSLVPFLRERVMAGSLTLGGLDDQLGGGTWASRDMAFDLVQHLPDSDKSRCHGILQRRLSWHYTADAPYSPSDKEKIIGCLNEIQGRLSQPKEAREPWAEQDNAMVESLKRNFARDFTEDDFTKSDQELKWMNDRDRSMYLNFKWLFSRLPPHSKVIVWAATVHVAKDLTGIDEFEGREPLGSYIRRDFGDRAFSLGLSAYSGEYAFADRPVQQLSAASASSLEGQAFLQRDSDAVYLSRKQLEKRGSVRGRPLGTSSSTAHWDNVLDGLVIFRKEHAPAWLHR